MIKTQMGNMTYPIKMKAEGLDFFYGAFQALKNIHLEVKERQITSLIGPSGCGKSTFLRTLNRMNDLIPRSRVSGTVFLDGQNIYDPGVNPVNLRQRVGMVFQRPNPFPKSIYDNVAFGPVVLGNRRRSHLQEVVEKSLRGAALWDEVADHLQEPATELSLGQQQRLCIAGVLALGPEIIMLDEPALLRPGPHIHGQHRKVADESQGNLHDPAGSPQYPAGLPGCRPGGIFHGWRND